MNADEALKVALGLNASSVLDVGSGDGSHAAHFLSQGKKVTTLDLLHDADVSGDFLSCDVTGFDLVWCSHVLEHQPNPNLFLKKCFDILNDDGWLCVTVPPRKDEIVGGHLTLWNAGLLLYNLIMAGFDCSDAMVKTYGYNVSVIVKKKKSLLPSLKMDFGDIETLAPFFPMEVSNGFNGVIGELNWPS